VRVGNAGAVTYLREENQRLFEENQRLRMRIGDLENQITNWQRANDPETQHRCSICLIPKPMEDFWRDRSTKSGRRPQCKKCATTIYSQKGGRHTRLPVVEVVGTG
jgi:hypothetical protein